MRIGEIMEVIVYVQDMDSQVRFYQEVLGLQVKYPQEVEDYRESYWVTLDTGPCTLALHGGGKGRFGADAPKFVFQVQDIRSTRQQLLEKGVKVGEVRFAAPGVLVCDGEDPEGNKFSIESHEEEGS